MNMQAISVKSSAKVKAVPKREVSILQLLDWAFRVECASLEFGGATDQVGFGLSGVGMEYIMIERAKLGGVRIDGGGYTAPHPDADIVAAQVASLDQGHGGAAMGIRIAELARAGRMPDWMPGARPKCHPRGWRRNRHGSYAETECVGHYEERTRKGTLVRRESRVCPVSFSPTAGQIGAARRAYLDWWGALLDLCASFRAYDLLGGHVVTNEMPPMTPWLQENV